MPTIVGIWMVIGLPALIISFAKSSWGGFPLFVLFMYMVWLWATRYHVWQDHLPEREAEVEQQDELCLTNLLLDHIESKRLRLTQAFADLRARRLALAHTITFFRKTDENLPYRVSDLMINPDAVERGINQRLAELETRCADWWACADRFTPRAYTYFFGPWLHCDDYPKIKDTEYASHFRNFLLEISAEVDAEVKALNQLFTQANGEQFLRDLTACASWAKGNAPSGVRVVVEDEPEAEVVEQPLTAARASAK